MTSIKIPTPLRAVLGLVVFALLIGGIFAATRDRAPVRQQPAPKATIEQLPKQPVANSGEKDIRANTPSASPDGNASDRHGNATVLTNRSQWVTSESKAITVKSPLAQATLASGFELNGSATVDKIQYRLIDNNAGVISQGFIKVVDGNFAAAISFQSKGSSGRLDVYSSDGNDREINEVQLAVKL